MDTTIRLALISGIAALTLASMAQGPGSDGPPPGGFGGPPRGMSPFPVFQALDADHDGTISAKEIAGTSAAQKKWDKNRDGKLSRAEPPPQR